MSRAMFHFPQHSVPLREKDIQRLTVSGLLICTLLAHIPCSRDCLTCFSVRDLAKRPRELNQQGCVDRSDCLSRLRNSCYRSPLGG